MNARGLIEASADTILLPGSNAEISYEVEGARPFYWIYKTNENINDLAKARATLYSCGGGVTKVLIDKCSYGDIGIKPEWCFVYALKDGLCHEDLRLALRNSIGDPTARSEGRIWLNQKVVAFWEKESVVTKNDISTIQDVFGSIDDFRLQFGSDKDLYYTGNRTVKSWMNGEAEGTNSVNPETKRAHELHLLGAKEAGRSPESAGSVVAGKAAGDKPVAAWRAQRSEESVSRKIVEAVHGEPSELFSKPVDPSKEYVVAAAIKSEDGEIYLGDYHSAAEDLARNILKLPNDKRYRPISVDAGYGFDYGFYTNNGRYINRGVALYLAKEQRQLQTNRTFGELDAFAVHKIKQRKHAEPVLESSFRPPTQPIQIENASKGGYWMDRSGNLYPIKTEKYTTNEHNHWAAQALGMDVNSNHDFRADLNKLGWARITASWSVGEILIDSLDITPSQLRALQQFRDVLQEKSGDKWTLVRAHMDRAREIIEAMSFYQNYWVDPDGGIVPIDLTDHATWASEEMSSSFDELINFGWVRVVTTGNPRAIYANTDKDLNKAQRNALEMEAIELGAKLILDKIGTYNKYVVLYKPPESTTEALNFDQEGYWLDPSGRIIPIENESHEEWANGEGMSFEELIEYGWVRVSTEENPRTIYASTDKPLNKAQRHVLELEAINREAILTWDRGGFKSEVLYQPPVTESTKPTKFKFGYDYWIDPDGKLFEVTGQDGEEVEHDTWAMSVYNTSGSALNDSG